MSDDPQKKLYLVQSKVEYTISYFVEAESAPKAAELVQNGINTNPDGFEEAHQEYLGETIFKVEPTTFEGMKEFYAEAEPTFGEAAIESILNHTLYRG